MSGRLKIAIASTYPPTHCGVAEYTRLLVESMAADSRVSVAVLADRDGDRPSVGGILVRPSFEPGDHSTYGGILDRLAEIGDVDVLHIQHEYGLFGAGDGILKVLAEAKEERLARAIAVTMHTVYRPGWGPAGAVEFQSRLAGIADAIIVHSILQEFELHSQLGRYHRSIHLIPHGTAANPYTSWARQALAADLGLPAETAEKRVIAVPGFLRGDKDLGLPLKLARELENVLVVVGGEPREPYTIPEEGNLILLPRYLSTDEILKLASLSNIILLPYRDPPGKYAVSGVLHLVISSRRHVIGARTPRLVELYSLAPSLTYPPEDDESAILTIKKLIAGPENTVLSELKQLSEYANATSWTKTAYRHIRLYYNLARDPKK